MKVKLLKSQMTVTVKMIRIQSGRRIKLKPQKKMAIDDIL